MHGCPKEALQSEEYCQTHYLRPYEERLKKGATKSPLTAGSILQTAAQHMEERAATYDQQGGERSIGKTVTMFNTLTGAGLTDEQGWLFMACLKMVRAQQGRYRADSYEDGAAYFALAGESAAQERV
jgi:hypothetical protein